MDVDTIDLGQIPRNASDFRDETLGGYFLGMGFWQWRVLPKNRNPLHIFQEPGTYQIRLKVGDGICSSEATRQVGGPELQQPGGSRYRRNVIRVTERTNEWDHPNWKWTCHGP